MVKKNNTDKFIDILWLLAVAFTAFCLLKTAESIGLKCIVDLVEQKEYYQDFLWPAIYNRASKATLVVVVVAVFLYVNVMMDLDLEGKSTLLIKNISVITTSMALAVYMLFVILYLKGYSYWMIPMALVIVIGLGCTIRNIVICKKTDGENTIDDDKTADVDDKSDVDENIDTVWKPVIVRFNIMLVAVLACFFLVFANFKNRVDNARISYDELNEDIIDIGFGHECGMERNRAIVKLQFVNLYNETGRQYSMEVLEKEYANYKNGTGNWSTLWQFCRDSIDIELDWDNEKNDYTEKPYWVDAQADGCMAEHYLGKKYLYDEDEYNKLKIDLFMDIASFTSAVEEKLNAKGLTLSQSNDSRAYDREHNRDFWRTYTTASEEEVYLACEAVANEK